MSNRTATLPSQPPPAAPAHPTPIRCMLQQAAFPAFRVPAYRSLATRPGMSLKVLYGKIALPNVDTGGLETEYRELRWKLGGRVLWDGAFMNAIKRERFDAITMAWNLRYLSLLPGVLAAQRRGTGVAVWGHGYSKDESLLKWNLRKRIGLIADAMIVYSEGMKARLVDAGVPEEHVFVALNALDQSPIQAARQPYIDDPSKITAFRAEQGLDDAPVALFIARVDEDRGVEMLIEAVKWLTPDFPTFTAVIIGGGERLASLKEMAKNLGISDRVRLLGPVYGEEALAPWFMAADAFCFPRNIGLSILHAMGYGLPVITSGKLNCHGPEIEALEHETNGLLYQHGSISAMCEALRTLFEDRPLRNRLADAAHRTATERYTIERMADGLEAALRHAASQRTKR